MSATGAHTALTGVAAKPLERVPVRTRGSQATLSAWRLEVTSDQGAGAIILLELSPQESYYRGEGAFLGWPQDRLAEAYQALTKSTGESASDLELLQLG